MINVDVFDKLICRLISWFVVWWVDLKKLICKYNDREKTIVERKSDWSVMVKICALLFKHKIIYSNAKVMSQRKE